MAQDQGDTPPPAGTLTLCPPPGQEEIPPAELVAKPRQSMTVGQQRAQRTLERVRRRAARISDYVLAASEIDDDIEERPEGWSPHKFRVARDSRLPAQRSPAYLNHAMRMAEAFAKADAGRQAQSLNAQVMNVYVDQRVYPTRDVKE